MLASGWAFVMAAVESVTMGEVPPPRPTRDGSGWSLTALSAPAVLFTVGMIAFPIVYTVWLSFQSFSTTGKQSFAGLANYAKLVSDHEFWHGLWVTIALYVLSLLLQLVFGVWLAWCCFMPNACPASCALCSFRRS